MILLSAEGWVGRAALQSIAAPEHLLASPWPLSDMPHRRQGQLTSLVWEELGLGIPGLMRLKPQHCL